MPVSSLPASNVTPILPPNASYISYPFTGMIPSVNYATSYNVIESNQWSAGGTIFQVWPSLPITTDYTGKSYSFDSDNYDLIGITGAIGTYFNPYLSLITSEHHQDKFMALVEMVTTPLWRNYRTLLDMPGLFDINTAIGQQLDIVGMWVGISRYIPIPLTGVFFSFNTDGLGFNEGYWADGSTSEMTSLPDEDYRAILLAKVGLNQWDGSIPQALNALGTAFPNNTIVITDGDDMSMTLGIPC